MSLWCFRSINVYACYVSFVYWPFKIYNTYCILSFWSKVFTLCWYSHFCSLLLIFCLEWIFSPQSSAGVLLLLFPAPLSTMTLERDSVLANTHTNYIMNKVSLAYPFCLMANTLKVHSPALWKKFTARWDFQVYTLHFLVWFIYLFFLIEDFSV